MTAKIHAEKRQAKGNEEMERILLEQAEKLLLSEAGKITDTEEIPLWDAAGRVLSENISATLDQPPFPRLPLDGYAVRSGDIAGVSSENPAFLRVIDEVTAGHWCDKAVTPGTAVRIMTGAPIPDGADCVVMQEYTNYGEDVVEIYKPVQAWKNYCFQGEDYRAGDRILAEGTVLGAIETGILASLGRCSVPVYRIPTVLVITTGDEIVPPGSPLLPGKIYDSNLYAVVTRLRQWGMKVLFSGAQDDDAEQVAEKIRSMAGQADLIITTGGVSVGKKDILHDVLKILGCKRLFWGVAVKPGMPTIGALYQDKMMICLSGNPYGAAVNLELMARPVLAKMSRRYDLQITRLNAVIDHDYFKKCPVVRYVRAFYRDGHVCAANGSNASGIISNLSGCNCLIEIPAGTSEVRRGDQVSVVLFA